MANLAGIGLEQIAHGRLVVEDWRQVVDVAERVGHFPMYIDDAPAQTMLDIRAKARQVKRLPAGLALVIVDYLQLCSSASGFDKRHHQIEQISRGMKTLAKELEVAVLVLSQLNRESEADEPELRHLKESGAIEEDADVVLLLHPLGKEPDGRSLILAKIPKNRQGRRGRLGLAFEGATQRWEVSQSDVRKRGAS